MPSIVRSGIRSSTGYLVEQFDISITILESAQVHKTRMTAHTATTIHISSLKPPYVRPLECNCTGPMAPKGCLILAHCARHEKTARLLTD